MKDLGISLVCFERLLGSASACHFVSMILEPHGSPRTFPRTTNIVGSDSTTGLPTHGTHGKSHTGVAHWLRAMWSHVRYGHCPLTPIPSASFSVIHAA